MKTIAPYIELTKPKIAIMVLVMTAFGYFLATPGTHALVHFILTLIGTGMAGAGASVLNQYLERDTDPLMERTKNRPLPSGAVTPQAALYYGVFLAIGGCLLLLFTVNILAAFLALQSTFLYVLVYTPMKRLSWLNTSVGAIPGAMPPLIGWAAATGTLDYRAWILFAILYIWQHPHFYAIAWMYKDDYRNAGLKMLPVVKPDGRNMFHQVVWFSVLLIPVSLLPTLTHMTGPLYFTGALVSGIAFLVTALYFTKTKTNPAAKTVLRASIIYLPVLLLLILADTAI